jgi:ribosomal protein S18
MSERQGRSDKQNKFKKTRGPRPCYFMVNKFEVIDYKDINILKRFITDRGKISSRRNSGVSSKWQRHLSRAIKRARFIGLIPHCID